MVTSRTRRPARVTAALAAIALLLGCLVVGGTPASAAPSNAGCNDRANDSMRKLLECIRVQNVRSHQAAFQAIADANGGNRFAGLPGHDASVAYVVDQLTAAGYSPTLQAFDYLAYSELGPSEFEQTAPVPTTYTQGSEFAPLQQTDAGDVTASVTAVDLMLGLGNTSNSGCEAADFAGFPAGNIALVQRGSCNFEVKAENAGAAGATGLIVMNQGDTTDPSRQNVQTVTLGAGNTSGIPAVFVPYSRGVEFSQTPGLQTRIFTNVIRRTATTHNVLAETAGGDPNNVIVVGGHLDSVGAGPGINDNGSGTAAILETALKLANVTPTNKIRFAFWSAEESGLVGSNYYVANLSQAEKDAIALNLNFDMIGSPNYVRFVYDGDGSSFGLAGPAGSDEIEEFFEGFYTSRGLAFEGSQISFRSDYAAFFNNGIPFGGLFTGAEGVKTAAQAAVFGGTAGQQYDPCYHQACDTFANNSNAVLDVNSDAVAAATFHYAMATDLPG